MTNESRAVVDDDEDVIDDAALIELSRHEPERFAPT
jgi:hypothetical protein